MKTHFKKFFNYFFGYIILLFLFFSILPFLILSIYVNPCWDDFDYSETAFQNGFFKAQYIWYITWSGRYFSTAVLSSVNPLIFRSILGYKILTLIFILLFIFSIYFLISEISKNYISKKHKLICALAFCYFFVLGMPNVGLGLFWLPSSVIYQFANILIAILIILLIKFLNNKERTSYKLIISICFFIFAIEGSNEVSMLTTTVFFVSVFIVITINQKKINKHLLLFAVVSIISFCLMYFAPGNEYRLSTNPESHQLFFSIKNSFIDLFQFILGRIYNLQLLIFTLLFISFYSKNIVGKKSVDITLVLNPIYSIILFLSILFSGMFVSYWSLGISTPSRTLNVIYFLFLLGWFINIILILNYLYIKKKFEFKYLPKYAFIILCFAVFISFVKEPNSIKLAFKDIISGDASKFDSQLKDRYRNIYSNNSDTCKIDSIKNIPKTFFYYDIGPDPNGKYNRLQSQFFNQKFIIRSK